MIELAWLSLNDEFSRDIAVPVFRITKVRQDPDGSGAIITLPDGELKITESVSDVTTAITALWIDALAAGV